MAQSTQTDNLIKYPLNSTIIRDEFTPALISLIAGEYVWGGSRIFKTLFDLGSNQWRVISALSNQPGATASEICELLGMNKSIASRSINELIPLGLIAMDSSEGTKKLFLTPAGVEIHNQILPIALRREDILQQNLTRNEILQMRRLLGKMVNAFESLHAFDEEIIRSY